MQLWIDEHGIAGLTDNKGRQSLYLLPDERMQMETKLRSLIHKVSAESKEKYNETIKGAKRERIPSW